MLRAAIGATAVVQGGVYLVAPGTPTFGTWIIGLIAIASGALVGLGSVSIALSWFPAPAPNLLDSRLATIFVVIMAAAIVFLGPGAFSLDSYLFGRREIIIPPASRSPKS